MCVGRVLAVLAVAVVTTTTCATDEGLYNDYIIHNISGISGQALSLYNDLYYTYIDAFRERPNGN